MGHPCEGFGVHFQILEILSLIGSAGGCTALMARPLAGPVGQAKDQSKKFSTTHHCPNHTFVSICQWFPFVCKEARSLFQRCTIRIMRWVQAIEQSTE